MMNLSERSDEELAGLFLREEQSAAVFGLLLERLAPVLHARTDAALRRAGANDAIARDDLLQEATLAFLSAVTAYQPGRGASLRTFVSVCVTNRLSAALRKQTGVPAEQELFDETALPPGYESMDPQDLYAAMEDARRLQDTMQRQLTALERSVLEAHMAGERYEAIAKQLGCTTKAVDNALQRARKKLQRYL